jgi:integrase
MVRYYMFLVVLAWSSAGQPRDAQRRRFMTGLCLSKALPLDVTEAANFDRGARAGLDKKLVPYSARHTYGTYTMEKSGNAFAVSKSMGHADLKSMEPYQHQELEPLRVAINQCNRRKKFGQVFGQVLENAS